MSQSVTAMMGGMSLGPASPKAKARSSAVTAHPTDPAAGSSSNRLPPLMKKYMNPDLVRPANTGLQSQSQASGASRPTSSKNPAQMSVAAYQESMRQPLLKLAGVNLPVHSGGGHPTSFRSPAKSKQSLSQHTAHGLHGPAHSTTSRVHASSTAPQQHASSAALALAKKPDVGKYDGGLEADEAKDVNGESARILDMDSSASG